MRKCMKAGAVITGQGKDFPYTVVADLKGVGVVCKTSLGENIILQHTHVSETVFYVFITPANLPESKKEKEVK